MYHLKPLTSLRFAAAGMIAAFHASNYFPEAQHFEVYPLEQGVNFCVVLSGFILTHAYSAKSISVPYFIGMRLARLWPVHLATALMVILFVQTASNCLERAGSARGWR